MWCLKDTHCWIISESKISNPSTADPVGIRLSDSVAPVMGKWFIWIHQNIDKKYKKPSAYSMGYGFPYTPSTRFYCPLFYCGYIQTLTRFIFPHFSWYLPCDTVGHAWLPRCQRNTHDKNEQIDHYLTQQNTHFNGHTICLFPGIVCNLRNNAFIKNL